MILAAFIVYYLVDNLDFWLWPSIRHGHVTCLKSSLSVWWFWLAVLRFPMWTGHRIQKCNGPLAIQSRAVWQDMAFVFSKPSWNLSQNSFVGKLKSPQIMFFCCCLFICEICCDYVFGSPLKNWDRLLLYFRLPALRRLLALSRGLGLPIPKPFRAPFIPGITVRTERRNGRRWDNGEVCSAICNVFFEGRSLVQRENYPLMEGVMTLYRVMGSQVHVEIAGFLGLLDDVN